MSAQCSVLSARLPELSPLFIQARNIYRALPYLLIVTKPKKLKLPLSAIELHVLLVLAESDLYGYAILGAIEEESLGQLQPDIGSLYRSLARLESADMVEITAAPQGRSPGPGKARRYYRISASGRRILRSEAERLRSVVELADRRMGLQE